MRDRSVIVVGAGAAGLAAARELLRTGCSVTVLEAGSRIGGRIHTQYDTGAGIPLELGAEFVHGEAPETNRLLQEARLVTVPVLGDHVRADRGRWSPQTAPWEHMARVFARMDPYREPDRSFQEFLDEKPGGRRLAKDPALARGFVQGFHAADPRLISERALALEGEPTEEARRTTRVVQGYGALVSHLHREVGGAIRPQTVVHRIVWKDSRVRALAQGGAEFTARAAVITVPLPAVQDGRIAFEPEVPAIRAAARLLVMGHVERVCLVFRDRFWEKRAEELSYIHVPGRPFHVWWTSYPLLAPVIVGWSGGPPAQELTGAREVESTVVRELTRAFGMRRDRLEQRIESLHYHDWSSDPLVRGAYSYVGVGGTGAAKRLARPVRGTLFFAGEATDEENLGTVEGALASGRRAARQVLRAFG